MTSCCWLVVKDSERFASPIKGIFFIFFFLLGGKAIHYICETHM